MLRVARPISIMSAGVLTTLGGCTLTTSLGDLTSGGGPSPAPSDGGGVTDAPSVDAEASAPAPVYASCRAALAAVPGSKDGFYEIDPDGAGPTPQFRGYCDMTRDEGGWLRIDDTLIDRKTRGGVTAVESKDDAGRLVIRVYANLFGCQTNAEQSRDLTLLAPNVPWTRVRYVQSFYGKVACWTIAGGRDNEFPQPHHLLALDRSIDVVRDQVRMGGSTGDSFNGAILVCNDASTNFWFFGNAVRSATFILRRDSSDDPAGLSTVVDCGDVAEGTKSPLYWEYSAIFVR